MSREIYLSKNLKKLRGVSFGAINIRSLVRKLDDVMTILGNSEIDCLGICETWLNSSTADMDIDIQGYNMIRNDQDAGNGKKGGGE